LVIADSQGVTKLIHPRRQALIDRMQTLQQSSPDIEAAAVVSIDGLIIASALLPEMSEDRVSAMSAAMLSLGEQISKEMGRGSLEMVHIKGDNGYVVLMAVGEKAVLTALVNQHAKLGMIFLDMRHTADDLCDILSQVYSE
jgi:predicted regulator of Ras-like GTPase activity (Roadblock/LC7/MglB family)